jgi:hypothetical protein
MPSMPPLSEVPVRAHRTQRCRAARRAQRRARRGDRDLRRHLRRRPHPLQPAAAHAPAPHAGVPAHDDQLPRDLTAQGGSIGRELDRQLDERSAVEQLQHKGALRREETGSDALQLPAAEKKLFASAQVDLQGEAAVGAVEHAKAMTAGPSVHDADATVLDARHDLAVKLEIPVEQTCRASLLSLHAHTPGKRDRDAAPRSRGAGRRAARGRPHVCRPLAGRIDRLPRGVQRLQASLRARVFGMQIGMTGPHRLAERSANVFPGRGLVHPEKGEQRSFIGGTSHGA